MDLWSFSKEASSEIPSRYQTVEVDNLVTLSVVKGRGGVGEFETKLHLTLKAPITTAADETFFVTTFLIKKKK